MNTDHADTDHADADDPPLPVERIALTVGAAASTGVAAPGTAPGTAIGPAPGTDGTRCDRWLADALPEMSRSRIKALMLDGMVTINGETVKEPKTPVKPGARITIDVPPPEPATPRPQAIALTILHEDDNLIVIDKPAGLAVHPAPGSPDGTLVNALLAHCADTLSGIGGVARPGIVHRLDKETSGLIVCAKTDRAHAELSRQFAEHSAGRRYIAVCWGTPSPSEGTIDAPIGRDPRERKRMAVVSGGGKRAVTHYRVEKRLGLGASRIACRLETGRTHQIRVHLTHIGHPLIGDPVYGRATTARRGRLSPRGRDAAETFARQALHAAELSFDHPEDGRRMTFECPLPGDMAALIEALEAPTV
ncbi:RluA family pseudouridine synthase [Marivibrio halodurans]|uniref:Pseudouridine synthase n=1 Tax=Marivibrio halodurans TaxID=2039722 RepID=A0A8J7S4D4_9PROT|nr:RluA family pseudouridine synthase [Marivibrio halodurans]MBP5856509.1 RluA family pseudouridine synthase [Marivibrio halodurans]